MCNYINIFYKKMHNKIMKNIKSKTIKTRLKTLIVIGNVMLIIMLILTVVSLMYLFNLNSKLQFDKTKLELANIKLDVYSSNNEVINSNQNKNINLNDLNDYTVSAFLSIEDKDFYNHNGVNYKRVAGAMINNIKTKSFSQGASTISQQLIKNTHLTNEKTFDRKIKEMLLTRKMEKVMSKDNILETYLNVIYFGESAFGIEQASNVFFNKSAKNLSLAESALLAGVIKSPAKYSPIYNTETALTRRNLVLKEMYKDFLITEEEYSKAISEELVLNINEQAKSNYNSLYLKQVYDEAINILNISEKEIGLNGIKIYTYQNLDTQNLLDNIINSDEYYLENSFGNIADSLAVVIDNNTGGIIAYSGKSEYNLLNLKRQPGSAIKPTLVYAPALEYGYIAPITPILDEKIDINGYSPNNLGNKFYGYVSASQCVADSLNIPAVKLTNYVGIDKCKNFAKNLNIDFDKNDNGYAIALGGFTTGTRLIDLTNSYLPYSNNGKIKDAKFIKKIVGLNGKILYENEENARYGMSDDSAYLMHTMLEDGVKKGTSKALNKLPYSVAGKTGTVCVKDSNNNTDAISVAYTKNHTMGVWFGNTSNKKEYELSSKVNGGTYPTYVIRDTFSKMYERVIPQSILKPQSVVEVEIDINELNNNHKVMIANENCPERYKQKILVSNRYLPEKASDNYINFKIDNFDVRLENDSVIIDFNAIKYIDYSIIRTNNNKEVEIAKFNNKQGKIQYVDKNIDNDTKYSYKIVAKYDVLHSTRQTEEINIITPKFKHKYVDKLQMHNTDIKSKNNSWLYSINS